MAVIYDLDNEYGGVILSDFGTGQPALRLNSNDAGQPALSISSTASANPMQVDALNLPTRLRATAAAVPAVTVGRTVAGSPTIAAFRVLGTSAASAAVIGFGGGMISVTSILGIAATGANIAFDYVLPVEVDGVQRGIPLTSLISLPGAATF